MAKYTVFRKSLIIGIVILFVGAGVVPSISGTLKEGNDQRVKDVISTSSTNMNWQWAKSAGGTNLDHGAGIATDSSRNCYITGGFRDSALFGATTLVSQGIYDVFVAKLDTNGNWQWAKQAGGTGSDAGISIAVDGSGNCYITGDFQGSALFGTTTLVSQGSVDVFVAKLDTNGNWQWAVSAGGTNIVDDEVGISVDGVGNCYITGHFEGSALFGTTTLVSQGYDDVFVAKLNTNGNWQWATQGGGPNFDYGYGVFVDGSGNCYITGHFYGSALFGTTTLVSQGILDVFVAKLNTNGNWQWATQGGGTGYDYGYDVSVDGSGNCYITGSFEGSALFGTTLVSQGNLDVFVAKLSDGSNQPPNAPVINGPTSGNPGTSYTYIFTSIDPDGDDVKYHIVWGDGNSDTTGFNPSGTDVMVSHTWATKGTYTIKATAEDTNGLIGPEGTLSVTMPRTRAIQTPFLQFLENHPILFQLLQRLLNL